MAGAMTPYIVRQGDYLAKLAFVKGFDADEVWNDPKNNDLRKLRPDPNILAPGDILYLPDGKKDDLPIQHGTENSYSAAMPQVTIQLVLVDANSVPLANEPYEIFGLGVEAKGCTDDGGNVSFDVSVAIDNCTVSLPRQEMDLDVRIGSLDPSTESSGAWGRLQNLNQSGDLDAGSVEFDEDDLEILRSLAVERFQAQKGLEVTGVVDAATVAALVEAHGT